MVLTNARQFSIRTLLILTAVVAVDLGWLRSVIDSDSKIAITFGLHAAMVTVVWLCYRLCRATIRKTPLSRIFLGWFSTTLAGASFAALVLGAVYGYAQDRRGSVVDLIAEFVALAVAGGFMAGFFGFFAATSADMAAYFAPSSWHGRAHATLTGIMTAALTTTLFLAGPARGIYLILRMAVPIGFAIVICYPFGRLWDRANSLHDYREPRPNEIEPNFYGAEATREM